MNDQAKGCAKAPSTTSLGHDHRLIPQKKNLRQQVAHKIFTIHPQLFHSWARCG
jgi:hypothetical protein